MTSLGLWLLGIPLALSLGLLAGVLEFIPYAGPIMSAVPAVLVAFSIGSPELLAVIVLADTRNRGIRPRAYHSEACGRAATGTGRIPAVVIFGVAFGLAGVIFAHPLMVSAMVTVQSIKGEHQLRSS